MNALQQVIARHVRFTYLNTQPLHTYGSFIVCCVYIVSCYKSFVIWCCSHV